MRVDILIASTSPTYLEQSIQDLNITDPKEVKLFVQQWTRPGAIKRLEFAPLASQLPTWDLPLGRRQGQLVKCFGNDNGCAEATPQCCSTQANGWCCADNRSCCRADPGGNYCLEGQSCCGTSKDPGWGACCDADATCCNPSVGKPFCCDEDQKCDNDAQTCVNPTATVTETTTSWATETDTETVTTDGTTTMKTVSTVETTVFVTVSRGPTDDEATVEDTATDSDRKHKRFAPAAPHKHLNREAPATKTIQPVVLRPAASLNALADVYETKKATTTITDTETKTEWTTKYSTSTTKHKQTVTAFVQGQSTVTVGPTGTAASSSESGSGDGGPSKGTIIGAAVGGGLGLILIILLAFFLWRRRRKSANQTQPSQFYAANSEAPATAQKPRPPFMSSPPTPSGARDTWASSPGRSDYSQPPAYPSPMPELGNTQFAYEMHTSPQRSPQELYHPQYMSDRAASNWVLYRLLTMPVPLRAPRSSIHGVHGTGLEAFASRTFGKPATLVTPLIIGGFNVVYPFKVEGLKSQVLVRLPCPDQAMFPEEKTMVEVATAACIKQHTQLPIPKIFHHGVDEGIGPYMIIEDLNTRRGMSHALEAPRDDPNDAPILNPKISETQLTDLYTKMAECVLQLTRPKFPRIVNVLINDDNDIVGAIDWEFAYVGPSQFTLDPPWWLLLEVPEMWDDGIEDWASTYEQRLETWLSAMEGAEKEAGSGLRLSTYMRESWATGRFWLNYAARKSWSFDAIYWKYLDEKFFGKREQNYPTEGLWKARVKLLTENEREAMEVLVKTKVEESKD
ncbi:phosphotransferase family [Fusarium phyllophilum]|uniref:Phosphotransferase family n=1 Tax=Fusarium phyllophilum TaxID=47803 RepID=A0A8H5NHP1_9HYPO|nr:phosphotransferase family [Fusarium phyllophilum]